MYNNTGWLFLKLPVLFSVSNVSYMWTSDGCSSSSCDFAVFCLLTASAVCLSMCYQSPSEPFCWSESKVYVNQSLITTADISFAVRVEYPWRWMPTNLLISSSRLDQTPCWFSAFFIVLWQTIQHITRPQLLVVPKFNFNGRLSLYLLSAAVPCADWLDTMTSLPQFG